MSTAAEKRYMAKVAALFCVVCRNAGLGHSSAEIHHIRTGMGKGQRAGHGDILPLCPAHHRTGGHGVALHAGRETWQAKYGTELELLAQTRRELGIDVSNEGGKS